MRRKLPPESASRRVFDRHQAAAAPDAYRAAMSAMHQPFEDTCTTCGHAGLRREQVRSAFWEGARLVVVEGVPALCCSACGERFYDEDASAKLEALRREGFPAHKARCEVRVPVFSLDAGAGAARHVPTG